MGIKNTYRVTAPAGTFTRTSARVYAFAVVRRDGWHQFSQTRAAAERELRYQLNRGRDVVLLPVERV